MGVLRANNTRFSSLVNSMIFLISRKFFEIGGLDCLNFFQTPNMTLLTRKFCIKPKLKSLLSFDLVHKTSSEREHICIIMFPRQLYYILSPTIINCCSDMEILIANYRLALTRKTKNNA